MITSLHDDILEANHVVSWDIGEEDSLEGHLFVYSDTLPRIVLLDEVRQISTIDFDGCLWLVGILAWGDDR